MYMECNSMFEYIIYYICEKIEMKEKKGKCQEDIE